MDGGRMGTVCTQIVQEVSGYDTARLRRAAASVVRLGLQQAPVQDPRLAAALAALRANPWDDTQVRHDLRALVGELDQRAWDVQDAAERGAADEADYDLAFARARAVGAVDLALDTDPVRAALEAAYEVQAGLGDLSAVTAALRDLDGVLS